MSEITTKNRILDTAEELFAKQGFAATSLRAIIKEAGVNTASAHYHFGSKEGLIEAVLRRQAAPINDERLASLEELEQGHADGPLPLEALVESFVAPAIRRHFKRSGKGLFFPQLFGRAVFEPDEKLRVIIRDVFTDVFIRYTTAFRRALPHLSPEEVQWRMHFMIGAMVFTVTVPKVHAPDHAPAGDDTAQMIGRVVEFVTGGWQSPVREPESKGRQ
jgi:AcrR family transcriptional regulator